MKIIILSVTKYKEKDGIINAISESESISLTAKGILDPKCKNHVLNNVLSIADVDFIDGNYKYPLLKRHKILVSSSDSNNDYYYLTTLLLLSEAALNLLDDDERYKLFKDLENALLSLKKGVNYLKVCLIYLSKIITLCGVKPEINHCVYCGSKQDIVAFSFVDGGFICKNCVREDTVNDLSPNQLLLLRASFMANVYDLPEKLFNKSDAIHILNKFYEFINDSIGYKLNTIDMLLK